MQNNVLVTGGAGFIGSALVRELYSSSGCIPHVMDNYDRGSFSNIEDIGKGMIDMSKHCINVDISKATPDFSEYSTIFHLAAKVTGIQYNISHNLEMLHSNIRINLAIADALARSAATVRRVMWVSTACVYPHNAPIPTPEDGTADICDPEPTNKGYGIAKWVGEQQAIFLSREYEIPITVVRFFNAFGERDYYDPETSHVAPAIIKRVLDGENPVVVWGTGKQTRSLVDSRDIARALVDLANCDRSIGHIVNIGHADEISIYDLAMMIVDMAYRDRYIAVRPDVILDRSKPDGYARRAADTTKLMDLIGWIPNTPIYATLSRMMRDYDSRRCEYCNRHPCICAK